MSISTPSIETTHSDVTSPRLLDYQVVLFGSAATISRHQNKTCMSHVNIMYPSYRAKDRCPNCFESYRGFLKWVSPTTMGFSKNDQHLGCEMGGKSHHLRKHPYLYTHAEKIPTGHHVPRLSNCSFNGILGVSHHSNRVIP